MRNVTRLCVLSLLVCGGYLFSQSVMRFTNSVDEAQAVAAHLKTGMREEEVVAYMASKGFHSRIYNGSPRTSSADLTEHWSANYNLTNSCSLLLDYTFTLTADGHANLGHGRLDSAHIASNGVTIISIPLTYAP